MNALGDLHFSCTRKHSPWKCLHENRKEGGSRSWELLKVDFVVFRHSDRYKISIKDSPMRGKVL